jgi:hypothetical protein
MKSKIIKAKIEMINMGILPALTGRDLIEMRLTMSESEKRTASRKFRKQWKKVLKNNPEKRSLMIDRKRLSDRDLRRNRCVLVADDIISKTI